MLSLREKMNEKNENLSKSKIDTAVDIALRYGMIKETHHMSWVIDQMLRCILDDKYQQTIHEYNESDLEHDSWDIGIAP